MKRQENVQKAMLSKRIKCEPSTSTSQSQTNSTRACGEIERLQLKNFMCHANLDIKFKGGITFLQGRNGSGKSAILSALTVGLGGTASLTERANAVKTFIKTGKQAAEVSVTLHNDGRNAYKSDVYGKAITVVRKLAANGNSQYILKSANGKAVSNKKSELLEILNMFAIKINNPVVLLNQDASRYFLHSKNAKDKYKFFMLATGLEELHQQYYTAKSQLFIHHNEQKKLAERVQDIQQEIEALNLKKRMIQNVDQYYMKIEYLKKELAWAVVAVKEKDGAHFFTDLRSSENKLLELQNKLQSIVSEIQTLESGIDETRQQHHDLVNKQNELASEYQGVPDKIKQKKETLRQIATTVKMMEVDYNSYTSDMTAITERIQEFKNMIETVENKKKARQSEMQSLEVAIEEKSALLKNRERDIDLFQTEIVRLKSDLNSATAEVNSCQEKISKLQYEKKNIELSKTNRLQIFGKDMPKVLELIDAAFLRGKFSEKPRGPLGNCFTVKESKWTLAVEICLSNLLFAFCVDNLKDMKALEDIFKQLRLKKHPAIIISKFHGVMHDVSRFRPELTRFPTVLDMIHTDDVVILNTLIDQRTIENIVLIEDKNEALDIMLMSQPKNVAEVFTLDAQQLYCRPTFRSYACRQEQPRFLAANVNDILKNYESKISALQTEGEQLVLKKNQVFQTIHTNEKHHKESQTKLNLLNSHLGEIKFMLTELKEAEDSDTPVDLRSLEQDLQKIILDRKALCESWSEKKAEFEEVKESLAIVQNEYRQLFANIKSIEEQDEPVKKKLNELECSKQEKLRLKDKIEAVKLKITAEKDTHQSEFEAFERSLQVDIERAKQVCEERIETTAQPRQIEAKIQATENQIQRDQQQHGTLEDVELKLAEAEQRYNGLNRICTKMKRMERTLEKTVDMRVKAYGDHVKFVTRGVIVRFTEMLSPRNYSGHLSIDHNQKQLTMKVQPYGRSSGVDQDVNSLSGGERSFTTIAFLLALWEFNSSPIRILDEFDVFMDLVNRKISMDMLMSFARSCGMQFLFLTPQNIGKQACLPGVELLRLNDPNDLSRRS